MEQKYINDKNSNRVLPITHFDSVRDSSGNTLTSVLGAVRDSTNEERAYAPANYSGMGRVVLKKNMVSGVNTLTQAMLSATNTVYVIKYDFVLGADITVPANCVLQFDGGSISGEHTIIGANTGIQAGLVKIFSTDVALAGTWNVSEAYPEWFGAKGDGITNDTVTIQKVQLFNAPINGSNKTYAVGGTINLSANLYRFSFKCLSQSVFVVDDSITIDSCVFDANSTSVNLALIKCIGGNVKISNSTVKNIHSVIETGAYGVFVDIEHCTSIIKNCLFENISDARNADDPVGEIKGMCGGIYYTTNNNILTSEPKSQYIDGVKVKNIYTALPSGEINYSSIDADAVRVFVADQATAEDLLNAQNFTIRNLEGEDVQKRMLKLSGATNCVVDGIVYKGNTIMPSNYPAILFSVMDCNNISISNIINTSGCVDETVNIQESKNVVIDNCVINGNGTSHTDSTAHGLRVDDNTGNIVVKNLKLSGFFAQFGRVYNNKYVSIQANVEDASTSEELTCNNNDYIKLDCTLKDVTRPFAQFDSTTNIDIDIISDTNNNYLLQITNCRNANVIANIKNCVRFISIDNSGLSSESNIVIKGNIHFLDALKAACNLKGITYLSIYTDIVAEYTNNMPSANVSGIVLLTSISNLTIETDSVVNSTTSNEIELIRNMSPTSNGVLNIKGFSGTSTNSLAYRGGVGNGVVKAYSSLSRSILRITAVAVDYIGLSSLLRVDSGRVKVNGIEKGTVRPTLTTDDNGTCFFDTNTSINKPIWWTGTAWVDATGAPV